MVTSSTVTGSTRTSRIRKGTIIAAGALALVIVLFIWRVSAAGRLPDFVEFLVDRREGAGQTQPDRGATCLYDLALSESGQDQLLVTRKAHGQLSSLVFSLSDKLIEPHFGGQQALIEAATTADTFNCITNEFDTHDVARRDGPGDQATNVDAAGPISRVLFSETGRNLALILQRDGQEGAAEVYSFKPVPGQSEWNANFEPLKGAILYRKIAGESLIVVIDSPSGPVVHTYNYRGSHKKQPWNEFDPEMRPFVPPGALTGEPRFTGRGKNVEFEATTESGQSVSYRFDFSCRQALEGEGGQEQPPNDKPCAWTVVQ